MGWAKYYEDNLEIITSRLELRRQSTDYQPDRRLAPSVIVDFFIPTENVKVNTSQKEQEDQYIICKDCGRVFRFSVGEQHFYKKMSYSSPKRCKQCREHRKSINLMRSKV